MSAIPDIHPITEGHHRFTGPLVAQSQHAWATEQNALREAREKTRKVRNISTALMHAIEQALETRTLRKNAAANARTQFIGYEGTVQSSHLAHANFFLNQLIEEHFPVAGFAFLEPIPCSPGDYGHRMNKEEIE